VHNGTSSVLRLRALSSVPSRRRRGVGAGIYDMICLIAPRCIDSGGSSRSTAATGEPEDSTGRAAAAGE